MATYCNHPADIAGPDLLMRCPDCGAECNGDQIGRDALCYDESCPLHVMATRMPDGPAKENLDDSDAAPGAGGRP